MIAPVNYSECFWNGKQCECFAKNSNPCIIGLSHTAVSTHAHAPVIAKVVWVKNSEEAYLPLVSRYVHLSRELRKKRRKQFTSQLFSELVHWNAKRLDMSKQKDLVHSRNHRRVSLYTRVLSPLIISTWSNFSRFSLFSTTVVSCRVKTVIWRRYHG